MNYTIKTLKLIIIAFIYAVIPTHITNTAFFSKEHAHPIRRFLFNPPFLASILSSRLPARPTARNSQPPTPAINPNPRILYGLAPDRSSSSGSHSTNSIAPATPPLADGSIPTTIQTSDRSLERPTHPAMPSIPTTATSLRSLASASIEAMAPAATQLPTPHVTARTVRFNLTPRQARRAERERDTRNYRGYMSPEWIKFQEKKLLANLYEEFIEAHENFWNRDFELFQQELTSAPAAASIIKKALANYAYELLNLLLEGTSTFDQEFVTFLLNRTISMMRLNGVYKTIGSIGSSSRRTHTHEQVRALFDNVSESAIALALSQPGVAQALTQTPGAPTRQTIPQTDVLYWQKLKEKIDHEMKHFHEKYRLVKQLAHVAFTTWQTLHQTPIVERQIWKAGTSLLNPSSACALTRGTEHSRPLSSSSSPLAIGSSAITPAPTSAPAIDPSDNTLHIRTQVRARLLQLLSEIGDEHYDFIDEFQESNIKQTAHQCLPYFITNPTQASTDFDVAMRRLYDVLPSTLNTDPLTAQVFLNTVAPALEVSMSIFNNRFKSSSSKAPTASVSLSSGTS